jgi:hypothetical protein
LACKLRSKELRLKLKVLFDETLLRRDNIKMLDCTKITSLVNTVKKTGESLDLENAFTIKICYQEYNLVAIENKKKIWKKPCSGFMQCCGAGATRSQNFRL